MSQAASTGRKTRENAKGLGSLNADIDSLTRFPVPLLRDTPFPLPLTRCRCGPYTQGGTLVARQPRTLHPCGASRSPETTTPPGSTP